MRWFLYFLLGYAVCVLLVVAIAGKRGRISRKPVIELFPDMNRQPKLRPEVADTFFPDQRASRQAVAGTIALEDNHYQDLPINTGRETGRTNYVTNMPVAMTAELLARGQQRFNINCSPCHGEQGDGNGVVKRLGLATVKNLHEKAVVELPDGAIFNTITYGTNTMGPYGANVVVEDRWAIVAYLRALQLSRLGLLDDVPEPMRAPLKK